MKIKCYEETFSLFLWDFHVPQTVSFVPVISIYYILHVQLQTPNFKRIGTENYILPWDLFGFYGFYGKSTDFMVNCHFFMASSKFNGLFYDFMVEWEVCKNQGDKKFNGTNQILDDIIMNQWNTL